MKKLTLAILLLVALPILSTVAGCSKEKPNNTGAVTSHFHIQDNGHNPVSGIVFHYTDPSGATKSAPATDARGNMAIVTDQAGKYSVNSATYPFSPRPPMTGTTGSIGWGNGAPITILTIPSSRSG